MSCGLQDCFLVRVEFDLGTFLPLISQIAKDLRMSPQTISISILAAVVDSLTMAAYSTFCFGTSPGRVVGMGIIGDIYKLEEHGFAVGIFFGLLIHHHAEMLSDNEDSYFLRNRDTIQDIDEDSVMSICGRDMRGVDTAWLCIHLLSVVLTLRERIGDVGSFVVVCHGGGKLWLTSHPKSGKDSYRCHATGQAEREARAERQRKKQMTKAQVQSVGGSSRKKPYRAPAAALSDKSSDEDDPVCPAPKAAAVTKKAAKPTTRSIQTRPVQSQPAIDDFDDDDGDPSDEDESDPTDDGDNDEVVGDEDDDLDAIADDDAAIRSILDVEADEESDSDVASEHISSSRRRPSTGSAMSVDVNIPPTSESDGLSMGFESEDEDAAVLLTKQKAKERIGLVSGSGRTVRSSMILVKTLKTYLNLPALSRSSDLTVVKMLSRLRYVPTWTVPTPPAVANNDVGPGGKTIQDAQEVKLIAHYQQEGPERRDQHFS
ncbi:hypothetical protein FISHEDRAFT_61382 [Fistulina hepatica ATCC 64428]|uniref:Uncharacterized protein n=1 Tax=Fistulina hepatica ATCC 64428 TaxID=1128425 RepID=A0A0D7A550_9AGAR|nr:hypothetical protein FISHEDRAFT_61382 [Fistulina hepatica ATCC 64428]